jgi:Zn-dependent peptidase ImmA (M78 family)
MTLRRGFKTEANWYARELRRELNLAADAPLCPKQLADHLSIKHEPLEVYAGEHPDQVAYLRGRIGQNEFSAVTLCHGSRRHIIYNDAHSPKRRAADLIHELSHCILLHPAKPPFDENGSRHYEKTLEDEANWLGPALLLSEEAALAVMRQGLSLSTISDTYGVSEELVRMRLNVTGAYRRVSLGRRAA